MLFEFLSRLLHIPGVQSQIRHGPKDTRFLCVLKALVLKNTEAFQTSAGTQIIHCRVQMKEERGSLVCPPRNAKEVGVLRGVSVLQPVAQIQPATCLCKVYWNAATYLHLHTACGYLGATGAELSCDRDRVACKA